MASVSYSFVDVAVLDQVRRRFAAGDALVILSTDLTEVLWANGPGAALLGFENIATAIGAEAGLSVTARRQIAATPRYPDIGDDRAIAVRLARGLSAPAVNLHASAVRLPDGEGAILLARPAAALRLRDEATRAAAAVEGFDAAGQFAALIDAEGRVSAASEGFARLGIAPATLRDLVADVREEEDRLVKRLVDETSRRLPAALARLTDEPASHLLIVVDEQNEAPQHPPVAAPPARSDAAEPAIEEQAAVAVVDTPAEASGSTSAGTSAAGSPAHLAGTVRFAWRTDAEGRFTALSETFKEAVGAAAADVMGRRFRDVSNAFGLDPEGRISTLLERRDTWSGRTVLWPLAGTDMKVPVDLAALPVYGRGRVFEGFHGFGLVRLGDAVPDPEGIGLVLTPGAPLPHMDESAEEAAAHPSEEEEEEEDAEDATPGAADTPPEAARPQRVSDRPDSHESDKIIRLAEHRAPAREGALSPTEQTAFREIGDRLRRESAADDVDATQEPAAPEETEVEKPAEPAAPTAREAAAADDEAREAAAAEKETQPLGASGREPAPPQPPETASPAAPSFLPSAFQGAAELQPADAVLLTHLPLPILVHSGDVLHYANQAFFALTGYDDLSALERAGGIDALFPEPYEAADITAEGRCLNLKAASGETIAVRAHLQSVPWRAGKALLLALRRGAEPAAATLTEETAPAHEIAQAYSFADAGVDTAELQMHLAEMRAIVDTATDGVAIIDNEGRVRSTNRPAEALFGFDAKDVSGKPFTALFAIESQRAVQEYLNGLSDNGVASVLNDGLEVIGREAQGRFIPLFMTIGRLPHQSGFCAVLRDITQWKRTAEELTQARAEAERASAQKTEFLARVSHEIRTPLNAIIGFSELMIDEKFGPIGNDRYRDYLRDINRSGNHVLDLVNDLLDISKIEAGEQEMHYEAVPLNDVLGETVAMMQPQANRERVIIRSSFASNLPDVVADPRSVRQIALNLLSNAVRYTQAGGQVIVSTAYAGDGSVIMRVRDTGVGMSPAEIDEALKPFKQINTLKRKRGDGTGLGLPLTRAMVEANRASFSINSAPGEGTLVEVSFPPTRVLAE
ncbi:PAS domain S-box protein [Nitratireductor sp. ZSWI3]|uniref:PAS domain S-box protein n=1 Tax=Nitratireductor sp. ZSWI3 TaxID=2966359 RepID=UPI0021500337|nr:PAS domain S-box protein [Nitratireductor sp. ZSWI3]MCR4268999.1 PAS domain S-box protein [Nitratireductor sp. ZSWI3]